MIVFLLLILFPLGVALLTYAFFWYETANGAHRQYLENLAGGRLGWLLTKGILSSYVSFILTIVLFPTSLFPKWWQPEVDPGCSTPPIILVHGLYHNASAWTLYRRRLKAAGFANIYFLGYSSWNQTFDGLVKKLEQLISEVIERFPDRPPILIGHSLGGLLIRGFMQSLGDSDSTHIGGAITLGTPHQGSKLAAFGLGGLAKSLMYRGTLINRLEEKGSKSRIPCVALYSPLDNMVLPTHALQTSEAGWVHQEISPISHVAMLYHRQTAELAIEYLKSMCLAKD